MLMSFQLQLVPMSDQPTTTPPPTDVIQTEPTTPPPTTIPPKGPKPPKKDPERRPEMVTWGDLKARFGH
jgi:hypothetical protein